MLSCCCLCCCPQRGQDSDPEYEALLDQPKEPTREDQPVPDQERIDQSIASKKESNPVGYSEAIPTEAQGYIPPKIAEKPGYEVVANSEEKEESSVNPSISTFPDKDGDKASVAQKTDAPVNQSITTAPKKEGPSEVKVNAEDPKDKGVKLNTNTSNEKKIDEQDILDEALKSRDIGIDSMQRKFDELEENIEDIEDDLEAFENKSGTTTEKADVSEVRKPAQSVKLCNVSRDVVNAVKKEEVKNVIKNLEEKLDKNEA